MQALYERYGPSLRRKAERLLRNQAEAEDLVQGLFVDLWQRGAAAPDLPYLFRAVTNRCLNVLRDGTNRQRLLGENASSAVATSSEGAAISADLLARLVGTLDEKRCSVLVAHWFDDMTQEEIAEVYGLSRKTVGKYLNDVRDALAKLGAEVGS